MMIIEVAYLKFRNLKLNTKDEQDRRFPDCVTDTVVKELKKVTLDFG